MRELLVAAWVLALAFFVWEFVVAATWHERIKNVRPRTIRLVDVAFAVTIVGTIYYLATH